MLILAKHPKPSLDRAKLHRGWARQRSKREAERRTRRKVVGLVRWACRAGLKLRAITAKLGLCVRTVKDWIVGWAKDRLKPCVRGRPVARSSRRKRRAVLASLQILGPRVGVAVLRGRHRDLSRAEIVSIQRRYRHRWQQSHREILGHLVWNAPGRTWAMDFTEPEGPIDGQKSWALLARDLSSGRQLWATPHEHADQEASLFALHTLFALHGAPLVIKTDNGGHFRAKAVEDFLRSRGVLLLPSEPHYPQYNGSIEAGIGSFESRANYAAYLAGRPGFWSAEDMGTASRQANETARPKGPHGPTPDEAWRARKPITDQERAAFLAEYQKQEALARTELNFEVGTVLPRADQDEVDRLAIPRALVEHRILEYQRRVITPAIRRRK